MTARWMGALPRYFGRSEPGEYVVRQDAPVGHHDDDVRGELLKDLQRRTVTELLRLVHGQAGGLRDLLYGAGLELMPAVFGLVRLAENARDVEALVDQFLQGAGREIRRTHEDDPHAPPSDA